MSGPGHEHEYDVVVVGSGAGGCAVAGGLAEAGRRVLLLERGRILPRDGATLDIDRVVHRGEFRSSEAWVDGRGRQVVPEEYFNLGGKTRWYGAALLRYAPHEFEADPYHRCTGWPFGYEELAPWYADAERRLGVRNFPGEPDLERLSARLLARSRGWRCEPLPLGLSESILGDQVEARHFDGFASVAGHKADGVSAFLDGVTASDRLTVQTSARVTGLLGEPGSPLRISGVRLEDGREYRAPAIVLSCGALHSPRLLQDYLVATGLARSLPVGDLVGRMLKLHLLTAVVAVSPGVKRDVLRKTRLFLNDRLGHSSVQPLGFDGELIGTLVPALVPRALARGIGTRAYGFFLQTEDGSDASNRVLPAPVGGAPVIDYDARRLPEAEAEHRRLVRRFMLALARAGMASFSRRIGLSGTAHACGTLVTGIDPRASVVDRHGRVHGLDGLFVADGSVLPRSSRVNPSLTIFAWGLRLADRLARRQAATAWGHPPGEALSA